VLLAHFAGQLCCSVLHGVAMCCSVLQCVAVCCCVLQCVCCSVLPCNLGALSTNSAVAERECVGDRQKFRESVCVYVWGGGGGEASGCGYVCVCVGV